MKRDADLQDLSRIASRMAALQTGIDAIRASTRAREADLALDPSRLSGADVTWQASSAEMLRGLQRRQAGLAAAREAYLGAARRSFGRAEALRLLAERLDKDRR
ncbi:hypothetical protein [Oceaniglobus roseus]|uniref:hypothetical protein n=1 Tax=Oceaniglobus roseus TaxID=1737570 RepID=UPI0012FFF62E|nr:hypothetical protein [Kandeliimicrobium roseum]